MEEKIYFRLLFKIEIFSYISQETTKNYNKLHALKLQEHTSWLVSGTYFRFLSSLRYWELTAPKSWYSWFILCFIHSSLIILSERRSDVWAIENEPIYKPSKTESWGHCFVVFLIFSSLIFVSKYFLIQYFFYVRMWDIWKLQFSSNSNSTAEIKINVVHTALSLIGSIFVSKF